jgi:DNA-binding NarL/FixJ family response regulator
VLVVEPEPAELARTCWRLLGEGVDVSTTRTAVGLADRLAHLQPDVVIMDVLMPGLDLGELARVAAFCMGGKPALVVHTKMLKPMLKRVIELRAVYGFIAKTDHDDAFLRPFREVVDRLVSEMPTQTFIPRLVGIATSGTYAMPGATAAAHARGRTPR